MSRAIAAYVATAAAMLCLDAIWLSSAAEHLYRPYLGDLLADGFRPAPAVAFYMIYVFGLVALAIVPAFRDGGWRRALCCGAVLGFVAYGTYDLTNQATMKHWSTIVTVADMLWGTLLSATAAVAGYVVSTRLVGPASV